MRFSAKFAIVSCLFFCAQAHAQTLVYSLSSKETAVSQLAHPSTYNIVTASIPEKLMKVRGYIKTEIFSVSMADTKRSLVFSDEGPYFEIIPVGMVVGGGKAYASGIEREWRTGPTPGVYSVRPSVYELTLDGSNRYRKLFEIQQQGEFNGDAGVSFAANLFISPSGTKIGYAGTVKQKVTIFIHDAVTGKLLQSLDTTNLCRDCSEISMGWLADEKRLFFTLNLDLVGGGDVAGAGTYIISEDGKVIKTPESEVPRQVLRPANWPQQLSSSGRFLAFYQRFKNYQPEEHVWGKDLQSGEEKELFMLPARTVPSSEPDVTLNILGWVEKK